MKQEQKNTLKVRLFKANKTDWETKTRINFALFLFCLPYILGTICLILLLIGCKSEIVEPINPPKLKLSGTWQNVKPSNYTDLNYTHYPLSVIFTEKEEGILTGSIKSDGFGILTGTDIPFTIYNGSFKNNTIHFDAEMKTTGYVLHFDGTLQERINKNTGKLDQLIVGQLQFEIGGWLSNIFQLYLVQQEIIYMKQT